MEELLLANPVDDIASGMRLCSELSEARSLMVKMAVDSYSGSRGSNLLLHIDEAVNDVAGIA